MEIKFAVLHPVCEIFPQMSDEEFQQLKANIRENGQREPITYWNGMLVDGRHRLRACQELGKIPREDELDEDTDPVAWAISKNLHRRHLTESQRGMVSAELAKLKHGDNQHTKEDGPIGTSSIEEASKKLNVSERTTKRAKNVIKNGCKELQQLVKDGKLSVSKAEEIVRHVKCPQTQVELAKEHIEAPKAKPKPKATATSTDAKVIDNRSAFQKLWNRCGTEDKSWIRGFIKRKTKEQEPAGDPSMAKADAEKVKSFRQCELDRLETLKEMFDALASHELDEVQEMIKKRMNAGK